MLFKGLSLSRKVAIIRTVLVLCYPEALDIASHSEQCVFFFFKADLGVTDLNGDVGVATLLEINLLSKIVIFLGNSLIISSQGRIFISHLGIFFPDAGQLPLCVLQGQLLVPEVGRATVEKSLCVFNTRLGAVQFEIEVLELVILLGGFVGASLVHLLQTSQLTPHLSSLDFNALDLTLQVLELGPLVIILITLGHSLFSEAASLEVLLIEHAL
jgi:hypothetical protein